jgi:hypothetical protein
LEKRKSIQSLNVVAKPMGIPGPMQFTGYISAHIFSLSTVVVSLQSQVRAQLVVGCICCLAVL